MKTIPSKVVWLCWLFTIPVFAQKSPFKPVFTNMTEFGVLFGQVRYNVTAMAENVSKRQNVTAQTFNGVQLRPKLAVGATVGVDWYNSALLMPVCAGVRYDLAQPGKKNLRVFTSLDTGYGFAWLNEDPTGYETRGGWVIAPGIGFRIGRPQNANFILSLSYKRQEAEADKPLNWNEIYKIENRVYNRVALRLGLSF
ncbi:hypothetical protein GCM10028803_09370 [Larkinella knui]|uniref:Outer membrane protein beta-barrel domain-containing protein n=1 Tax=Larkinella knui TaxID=2025310 RepID=A0A3P1CCR5_9BACT|nr:hypothetical protein [Larkinella knui]RRB11085.1 hypothetical protein EHT87_28515 [Larkinella knui]